MYHNTLDHAVPSTGHVLPANYLDEKGIHSPSPANLNKRLGKADVVRLVSVLEQAFLQFQLVTNRTLRTC